MNGFSGLQPIESFLYAMYDVDMTNLAVGFFVVFTQDVSFQKYSTQEELMPYKLSRLYISCREQAKTFFYDYLI